MLKYCFQQNCRLSLPLHAYFVTLKVFGFGLFCIETTGPLTPETTKAVVGFCWIFIVQ